VAWPPSAAWRARGDGTVRARPVAASIPPEGDTALHAGLVRDDGDIRLEREVDLLSVAAADEQMIEVGQPPHVADRPLDPVVPARAADLLARGVAELLVVRLAMAEGVVGNLQMRRQTPLEIEPRPETGAQRDDHLDTLAGDHGQSLQIGVVGDPHELCQGCL